MIPNRPGGTVTPDSQWVQQAIIRAGDVSRLAATLLLPYWFWSLYATTLNAAIAVLASVLPARRAAKLHPVRALRYE